MTRSLRDFVTFSLGIFGGFHCFSSEKNSSACFSIAPMIFSSRLMDEGINPSFFLFST
jgi:hypothetical protein